MIKRIIVGACIVWLISGILCWGIINYNINFYYPEQYNDPYKWNVLAMSPILGHFLLYDFHDYLSREDWLTGQSGKELFWFIQFGQVVVDVVDLIYLFVFVLLIIMAMAIYSLTHPMGC